MKPLPVPVRGGNLKDLRSFLNIPDDEFCLMVGWLASSLLPQGPYSILALIGEQGCGKSTLAEIAKRLVDPQKVLQSSPPKTAHDLAISADNRWVLSYENLTTLPQWMSDMICMCSTKGAYSTRSLYKNREEELFDFQRPVILNGISDFITEHADLTDRCVFLHLAPISNEKRTTEKKFWPKFDAALPSLFGALLDAVAGGLAKQPETADLPLPRMGDFGQFAEAVWRSLDHPDNEFLDTYLDNRKDAIASVLEDSPVGVAVMKLMDAQTETWAGTATELLETLNGLVSEKVQKSRRWPKRPNTLSNAIRKVSPSLRENDISVEFKPTGHDKIRTIEITKTVPPEDKGNSSSASSASFKSSKTEEKSADDPADDPADDHRPQPDPCGRSSPCGRSADDLEKRGSSALKSNDSNILDEHADNADDLHPYFAGGPTPGFEGGDWTKYP